MSTMTTAIDRDTILNSPREDKTYFYYKTLLEEWDKGDLKTKPEIRILFLDNQNVPTSLWKFPEEKELKIDDAFIEAQKANASSIVIAQNDPLDEITADDNSNALLEKFKKSSKGFGIRISDFLIFSAWGYNSFLENKRL